jgi:chemotaxis methyl-accepting protein methylase
LDHLLVLENLAHISFVGAKPAHRCFPRPTVPSSGQQPHDCPSAFIEWVLERNGLRPAVYRASAIRRRIPACLRRLKVASVVEARGLLERRPELLSFVLNTALIGVTGFFRDPGVFASIRQVVLPELLATRVELRVCGAGVSGGQELYSVAMLLAEAGALERSALLGVDCRVDAIRRAQAGVFNVAAMAGVSPGRRERFFEPTGGGWRVRDVLKQRIRWRPQDITTMRAGEAWDLVLFRNVGIYFTDAAGALAWTSLCAGLARGGFLVTGEAETPPGFLPLVRVAPSVYRREGD